MPSLLRLTREITGAFVSGVTDRGTSVGRKFEVVGGFVASGLRFSAGMTIRRLGPRPAKTLVLWEFERCSHARYVRESLSELDLDAEIRPCPVGGTRFSGELDGRTVPLLLDPNTGERIHGARAIVTHLHTRYGVAPRSAFFALGPVRLFTGAAHRVFTGNRGGVARSSKRPAAPLELWSFEASPYCRLVRNTLSELEVPYLLHNVAKDSPRRDAFVARAGRMQVPWLHDPNTGTSLFESLAIQRYLETTYGA